MSQFSAPFHEHLSLSRLAARILLAAIATSGVALPQSDELRNTIQLNGPWQATHDPACVGFVQGWHSSPMNSGNWTALSIPGAFEANAAFAGKDGVFWLRTEFTVPARIAQNRRLRLQFERVLENCKVWVNGEEAGSHSGDSPFFLDITNQAVAGKNLLTMQVLDGSPGQGPLARRFAGIVGKPVVAETSAWTVERVGVRTVSVANSEIELSVRCENAMPAAAECDLKIEVLPLEGSTVLQNAALNFTIPASGHAETSVTLRVPALRPWSAESPNLFRVSARLLKSGVPMDASTVVAGLRAVDIQGPSLVVNGTTTRLRAAIDDGHEPVSLITPSDFLDPQRKVKMLKDAGFNAILTRGRQPMRALVDAADRLGMYLLEELDLASPAIEWMWSGLPFPANGGLPFHPQSPRTPTPTSMSVLRAQIERDANSPAVLWYSLADVPSAAIDEIRPLDRDNLFARERRTRGKNWYYSTSDSAKHLFLRPEFNVRAPLHDAARIRMLDLGDRTDFTMATVQTQRVVIDCKRALAGLGGGPTEESPVYAAAAEKIQSLLSGPFGSWFGGGDMLFDMAQIIQANTLRRCMEALRMNSRVGVAVVGYVNDAPEALGRGYFDIFGRPRKSMMAMVAANAAHRAILFPTRRAGEVPPESGSAQIIAIDVAPVFDDHNPFKIVTVEVGRPDKIFGQTVPNVPTRWPNVMRTDVSCGAGEGIYVVNPFWTELTKPEFQEVLLLGVAVKQHHISVEKYNSRPRRDIFVFGDTSDLWDEEHFLSLIDALETAKAGGTVIVAKSLAPDMATLALDLFPGIQLVPSIATLFAANAGPFFEGLPSRGLLGDPFNEIFSKYVIKPTPSIDRDAKVHAITVDEDGGLFGYSLIQIPYGKGQVVLTTLPIGELFFFDVVPRRILANIVEDLLKRPEVPAAIPDSAPDREEWRQKFQKARSSRATH
jgi:hypothetical protein